MENNVGDIIHCEEQLKSRLYCDDKEKLRKKLALLQREYLRTAQKLQRAERLDAVRQHVRSKITQQSQRQASALNTTSTEAQYVPQCQGQTTGPADSETFSRSQVIRFLLPSDAACPQTTPGSSHIIDGGQGRSPALRLRSRRSRLRWKRRSAEAGMMADVSEEGQEHNGRMETARFEEENDPNKSEETEVVNESEELFSASESDSPSLLLTHWNTYANAETGDMEGKEVQGYQEQREKDTDFKSAGKIESASLLLKCWNPATQAEGRGQDYTLNGKKIEMEGGESCENGGAEGKIQPCEENNNADNEQNEAKKMENDNRNDSTMEVEGEKREYKDNGKNVGILDSCTLVDGLLFPAEYYVRTTRRMTLSHSQPDMQAVILSQLSVGRHRRSRGRGRGVNRTTHTTTDFSSLAVASVDSPKSSRVHAADASTQLSSNSQSSNGISDSVSPSQNNIETFSSPAVSTSPPGRGRRRKRGRGRGRLHTPRSSPSLNTSLFGLKQPSDSPQATSSLDSTSLPLHAAEEPKLTLPEAVPLPDDPEPVSNSGTQPTSNLNGTNIVFGLPDKVYPIFVKSTTRTNRSTNMNRSPGSWQSLFLPSSSFAQPSLHPLPFQSSLVSNLKNLDIHQDFHLPDDQFAFLKLHKLRQVALESGVESFTSSSYNTRSSNRQRSNTCCTSVSETVMPHPLPLSLTPTITASVYCAEDKHATPESVDLQNLNNRLASHSSGEALSDRDTTHTPGKHRTENLNANSHTSPTDSVSVIEGCTADCVRPYKEQETVDLNNRNKNIISSSNMHGSVDHLKPQPHLNFLEKPAGKVNDFVIGPTDEPKITTSEKQTNCGVVHPLDDPKSKSHQTENKTITKALFSDCPLKKTPETVEACNDTEASADSVVNHLLLKSPPDHTQSPVGDKSGTKHQGKCSPHHNVPSELFLSPPVASASCPFITPHLPSCAVPSSPKLPSLGLTPHLAFPLTSSPSSSLNLPPPHSPSIQALSPPALSLCPSLPSSTAPASPSSYNQVEPPPCKTASSIQSQVSGGLDPGVEQVPEEQTLRCTHTLKAPAGGCLVDVCCFPGQSGGLCVAAAGKWAVCLWGQSSASDWSLIHTWTFNEPVISVFPVPDAAGLMCATLGQLEIKEVRMLSCSSLTQALLCEGVVQAVVGVSKSRVVTSSHSATASTLQIFTLSDNSSTPTSQPLVSPAVCVGALAPVEGVSDALIGTDECGHLFIWNLKTGQLLQRVIMGDDLSHTACLRGFSYCGVLFVLLQHQSLSSLEEGEAKSKDHIFSEKEEQNNTTASFSLFAVNPVSGKSVLVTKLYPPTAWSGRLCEADVNGSSVVGLSQSGCVCVWDLGRRGDSRMVWAPEGEGWHLARWGGGDVLLTGHHNGDVTLHRIHSETNMTFI